jgi:hypothetical protein
MLHDDIMDVLEDVASVTLKFAEDNLSDARHFYLPIVAPDLGVAFHFVVHRNGIWTRQDIQDEDKILVVDAIFVCPD